MQSPLFLQPDAILDLDPSGPRLYRRGTDRPKHDLTIGEAVALSILAADGDVTNARSCCDQVFGQASGAALVDHVSDRFWTYLGDGPPVRRISRGSLMCGPTACAVPLAGRLPRRP